MGLLGLVNGGAVIGSAVPVHAQGSTWRLKQVHTMRGWAREEDAIALCGFCLVTRVGELRVCEKGFFLCVGCGL